MDFRAFLEAGTKGEGPNASGARGQSPVSAGKPQTGGPFGGGGPKKSDDLTNVDSPASPLSPRYRAPWKKADPSKLSPTGAGQPPGPPQPVPPSEFVSRYMSWLYAR